MKIFSFFPIHSVQIFAIASIAIFTLSNEDIHSNTTGVMNVASNTLYKGKPIPDSSSLPLISHAEATLSGTFPDTAVSGSVKFVANSANGKVKMILKITVPAKAGKAIAVHIHEHGDCGDMGKMAHGHWNPTNSKHGKWGSASFHSGDIGNVKLNAKGKGTFTITTDLWTLGGKPDKNILGKSIIVHGGVDDYTTQPTGNSGTRIGCGVIQ